MSKRRKRRQGPHRGGEGPAESPRATETGVEAKASHAKGRPAASDWSLGLQLAFLVAVFAIVVLVAELAGAANLGVALGVGQIAFAIAVIYLLVRR